MRIIGTLRHKSFDNQPYIFDRSAITIELMDLSDAHSIENLIVKYKPTYFVNAAANAFVGESWAVPAQHLEINTVAVLHQLEAIRKHSPTTRYFNMGTSEEFAVSTKGGPQNEDTLLDPKSPYGASKCAARHVVSVWRQSYNLFALQGWTFNFESPIRGEKYLTRKVSKGVARIAAALKNDQPFEPLELGNLDSYRSWQHAADVADGVWKMLNQKEPKPYVLSAPDTHTVREFVERAFSIAGFPVIWTGQGMEEEGYTRLVPIAEDWTTLVRINPKFLRPADVTYLHGDATRAHTELGWNPKHSFPDLVHEMVINDLAAVGITL